jgi:hypothetical protein
MGLFSRKKKGPSDVDLERLKHDIKSESKYAHESSVRHATEEVSYLRGLKGEVNSSAAHSAAPSYGQRMRMSAVVEYALAEAYREERRAKAKHEAATKLDNGNVNPYRERTILTTCYEALEAANSYAESSYESIASAARDKGGFPKHAPKKKVQRYLSAHTPGYFYHDQGRDFKRIAESVGSASVAKLK